MTVGSALLRAGYVVADQGLRRLGRNADAAQPDVRDGPLRSDILYKGRYPYLTRG